MERFLDKVVVVTGAGGGIGAGYAWGFAQEGASVVVADIDAEGAERVAKGIIADGGAALATTTDVTDERSADDMADAAIATFGGIDVLVNNAGLFKDMETHSCLDIPIEYWNKFLDVSLTGSLICTRAVVPSMRERGGGAIVNQSSTAAWMGAGAYGTAKLALHSLTHSLARELGSSSIRVNAIAPGPTATDALAQRDQSIIERLIQTMPLSRLGEVEDHAAAALFLASADASWITGVVLNVDGGQMMRS